MSRIIKEWERYEKIEEIRAIAKSHHEQSVRDAARSVLVSIEEFSDNYDDIDDLVKDAIKLIQFTEDKTKIN